MASDTTFDQISAPLTCFVKLSSLINLVGTPIQSLKYLSLSFIKFLSFFNLLNKVSKSSIGFLSVSAQKFPPNFPPQKPNLSDWSITGTLFLISYLIYKV